MKHLPILAVCLAAACCSPAFGQSGSALMLKSWEEGDRAEFSLDAFMMNSDSDVDASDSGGDSDAGSVDMQWYEMIGRSRVSTERGSPAVGFEFSHLEFDLSTISEMTEFAFPDRLMDYSVGVGFGIGEWEGWEVAATVGVGAAGDELDHGSALYGMANLIFSREIDERRSWQFLINYNGNRTFLPDVPLPGIAFNHELSETFRYTAGFPYSAIEWKFLPAMTLDVAYQLPYTLDAKVSWQVIEPVAIFGAFQNRFNRYRWEFADEFADRDRDHIFFEQRRIEGGLHFMPTEWFNLTIAGGYAFDQELSAGWDSRSLDTLFEIDSGPYWRVGGELKF